MDEMPFGLARKETYAALSASDMEDLGKEASSMFLCGGVPLNDAVVKLAERHPSISPHQVKRVVEFANTETFQKLFEKQADDKNIEFDLADPGVILRNLDLGAKGGISCPTPSEYSSGPVKMAHADVEADLALARMFGVNLVPDGVGKTASAPASAYSPSDRVLADMRAKEKLASFSPTERILMLKTAQMPLMAGPAPQAQGATPQQQHHEQMLQMTRQVELEKKKQELASIQQKTLEMMQGPPPGMPGEDASVEPPPEVAAAMQGPPEGGAMGGPAAGPPGPPMAGPPQGGPPQGAPQGAPPTGPIPEKVGADLTKQAMDYAKSGRPKAGLVLKDLAEATSLERIKEATADPHPYPAANPYGDLIRARVTLLKLAEEANHARDRNEHLLKEAVDNWGHVVTQHVLGGGSFGEVAHAVAHVDDTPEGIKLAMEALHPYLVHHQIEPARMHAQLIKYDMEKSANMRVINPANPIVQRYATMRKLAEGQLVLEESARQLNAQLDEANGVLKEAMLHAHPVQ